MFKSMFVQVLSIDFRLQFILIFIFRILQVLLVLTGFTCWLL